MRKVVDDLGPHRLSLADDDRVREASSLVRHQCRMETAKNHWNATLAIVIGNLISPSGGIGLDWYSNGIGRLVKWNGFQPIIVETQIDPTRS